MPTDHAIDSNIFVSPEFVSCRLSCYFVTRVEYLHLANQLLQISGIIRNSQETTRRI